MYRLSKEYLNITISGPDAATISTDTLEVSVAAYRAGPVTWLAAEHTPTGCRVLVGPGTSTGQLDPGQYQLWVRVTDNPEIPVMLAGTLSIT